jgi:AraC-like DNA-binding protein
MLAPFSKAYQRAGPLVNLAGLLREFGVDPASISGDLAIDLDALTLETMLPFPTCLALLDRSARATGCPHLGLLLGSRYKWASHGIIYELANTAPTLRQSLLDFEAWQLGYSSGAAVYLHRYGQDFAFGYGVYGPAQSGSRQVYDLSIAIGCDILRDLTDGQVSPIEIHLCYDAPQDLRPYRRILKSPVRFNEVRSCLVIAGRDIDTPRKAADPSKRAIALSRIGGALGMPPGSTGAQLRHLIRPHILKDDLSVLGVAKAMGMNRRTLQRRLADEGVSFDAVRDDVRFAAARELLAFTKLEIAEIALALAYKEHSSFSRAFRRWSGVSPAEWRDAVVGGAASDR